MIEHPGKILWRDYLKPLDILQETFAKRIGISVTLLSDIKNGRRRITKRTAKKLAKEFTQTSIEYWMSLQTKYEASI